MEFPSGKVSPYELAELVFPELDFEDDRVLVGPDVGQDASVIEMEDRVMVLSSDPITGAIENPGWLSVHVNANDVAAMGASPEWFLLTLFLPEGSTRSDLRRIIEEVKEGCEELGVSLVGGHTEVTPRLERVLISGSMIGEAPKDRWVSASGAKPGDKIILTKSVAIEGTFILASDREDELVEQLNPDTVNRAKGYRKKLSVVNEALTAIKSGEVHAMHDVTEGGFLGGLYELVDASNVGFTVYSDKIPIEKETREICDFFGIDPLKTISSGSLLISVSPGDADSVAEALEDEGIKAAQVGEILKDKEKREMDGNPVSFPEQDELWKVF